MLRLSLHGAWEFKFWPLYWEAGIVTTVVFLLCHPICVVSDIWWDSCEDIMEIMEEVIETHLVRLQALAQSDLGTL